MSETDNGVDPKALMQEIRARVRSGPGKRTSGGERESSAGELSESLAELFHMADVDVPRDVRTHRPLLGAYVRLRRWVLREIRLTLDPVLARQIALNRALVRVVAEQQRQIDELKERLEAGGSSQ